MPAVLSWYDKNVMIELLGIQLRQLEIFIEFEQQSKNSWVRWSLVFADKEVSMPEV